MKTCVIYFSKSGNNKAIAQGIADKLHCPIYDILSFNDFKSDYDLIFLGGSLYFGSPDKQMEAFIKLLDQNHVKRVCIFSSNINEKDGFKALKTLVELNGITVVDEHYHALGKWLFSAKGHPDKEEIEKAGAFAEKVVKLYSFVEPAAPAAPAEPASSPKTEVSK